MKKSTKFSPEVRERAVRMVFESRGDYGSQWAAIESIAAKIGCSAQTLCNWVRQYERDTGQRDGTIRKENILISFAIKDLDAAMPSVWEAPKPGVNWDNRMPCTIRIWSPVARMRSVPMASWVMPISDSAIQTGILAASGAATGSTLWMPRLVDGNRPEKAMKK